MVESSHYLLEEALADAVAELCLGQQGVRQVDVRVEKPNALRFARSVAVEITRKR
jgi:dihydroneopterin aldolase